nr:hypothetical protein Iba_chr09cCG4760 [Ipomoea batatas]
MRFRQTSITKKASTLDVNHLARRGVRVVLAGVPVTSAVSAKHTTPNQFPRSRRSRGAGREVPGQRGPRAPRASPSRSTQLVNGDGDGDTSSMRVTTTNHTGNKRKQPMERNTHIPSPLSAYFRRAAAANTPVNTELLGEEFLSSRTLAAFGLHPKPASHKQANRGRCVDSVLNQMLGASMGLRVLDGQP